MTLGFALSLRNARLDLVKAAIDAGAGPGQLACYTLPRPATGAAPGGATLLGTLTFSDPCGPAASNGSATYNTINPDTSADATGNAAWGRITDSTGAFVADASISVNGGGGEIQFANIAFQAGQQIGLTSFVFTEGNP